MENFLLRPVGEIMLILLGLILAFWSIVGGIVLFIKLTKAKKFGKDGAEFDTDDDDEEKQTHSPHASCIHSRDIVELLHKQAAMLDECHKIEWRVLPDQMNYVEAEESHLVGRAKRVFLKLLRTKLRIEEKTGLVEHRDFHEYQRALDDAIEMARVRVRTSFKENHYAERTEQNFRDYTNSQVTSILQDITDYLNDAYHGTVVHREAIFDENHAIIDEFRTGMEKMFWNARDIAIQAAAEVQRLKSDFDALVEKTL